MKTHSISKHFAIQTAVAFLAFSGLFLYSNARAQNCDCLTATTDRNSSLCDDGCYTWALVNNCGRCIKSLTISDPGKTITNGCAVVLNPTHEQWAVLEKKDGSVTINPVPPDSACWGTGGTGNYPMQLTLCGVSKGDNINVTFTPTPAGCPDPYTEAITVP